MKCKKVNLLLAALIIVLGLVGCNTQEKKDAADAERLTVIEKKIDALFNEEKTDITDITQERITEIEALLAEEKDNKFSEVNLKRIDSILIYLDLAIDMNAFELEVDQLFDEAGGLLTDAEIDDVESNMMTYESEIIFYNRQSDKLTDAKEQLVAIEEVTEQVETLFIDGEVRSDVNREQEEEMRELIATLKSKDAQRVLEASLVKVAVLLSHQEKALVLAQKEYAKSLERQQEAKEATKAATEKQAEIEVAVEEQMEEKEEEVDDEKLVENEETGLVEDDNLEEANEAPENKTENVGEDTKDVESIENPEEDTKDTTEIEKSEEA